VDTSKEAMGAAVTALPLSVVSARGALLRPFAGAS
jgi:hypothetical protein